MSKRLLMWGSDELDPFDAINYLISKHKHERSFGKSHLLKQKSGRLSRDILWKLMNILLGDDETNKESDTDVEEVFNYHRRHIPDFGNICQISTETKFHKIEEITFKKYRLLTTADQKMVANWVKDGAEKKTQPLSSKSLEKGLLGECPPIKEQIIGEMKFKKDRLLITADQKMVTNMVKDGAEKKTQPLSSKTLEKGSLGGCPPIKEQKISEYLQSKRLDG